MELGSDPKVAIKLVRKDEKIIAIAMPGEKEKLPVEVALMKMVSVPPRCSNVLQLLEWFDFGNLYAIILEMPVPCQNLYDFMVLQGGCLAEAQSRDVMLQVVRASRHCCDRGILHRDVKVQNLLINTDTLQVKLIDFGCGDLLKDKPYKSYIGTAHFMPPEWVTDGEYMGIPATVWGLGVLLYYLVTGEYPFETKKDLDHGCLELGPDISRECFELIMWCLELNPDMRPTFDDLLRHEWFTQADIVKPKVEREPSPEVEPQAPSPCAPGEDFVHVSEVFEEEPTFPGPLIGNETNQEALIRFIRWKTQRCLENIVKYDQVETYFFWRIMELFCRQNNKKVIMCEVGRILIEGYKLIAKNLKHEGPKEWKEWCLRLTQLLFSSAPSEEHREAVIMLGDDFASRKFLYAAHICYVVAKVELGSRSHFELIGCYSVPFGVKVLDEAVKKTETYEYVLWLTSGLLQPSFQHFKLCYANRLAHLEQSENDSSNITGHKYYESMARAAISFPDRFKQSHLKRLISGCKALRGENAEPEWLLQLEELHRTNKLNADDKGDLKRDFSSPIHDMVSEIQDKIPTFQSPGVERGIHPKDVLLSRYSLGELLGKGGYGSVFSGIRKEDGKQVAIKIVTKNKYTDTMTIPGETQEIPLEVALMKIVSKPPRCSNVIELLEWFDLSSQYVMILERPVPCQDLCDFIDAQDDRMSEAQTRDVVLQLIKAVRHCCNRDVLHRDIKAENILINTETLQVKLIDFSCGVLMKDSSEDIFLASPFYTPPEYTISEEYHGIPATVWSLGIFLFKLLTGYYPFETNDVFECACLDFSPDVSRECIEVIMWCLELSPDMRPSFDDLLRHEWFTEAVLDKEQNPPETSDHEST
ncbi:uncharacterized protein Hap1MRO34_012592 [Clarias gariepinus]